MENLRGNIIIEDTVENWEVAVKLAAKPLVAKGKIDKKYIQSMIENINKFGFYVNLTDDVAMPHSRPEDGVKDTGLSLLKLNNPVKFGEKDISLVFVLAAKDNSSHVDILKELSDLLDDDEKIEKLKSTKKILELNEILNIL